MIDLNNLFEFSRNHCVAICSFLVPANLLATSQTLLLLLLKRTITQIRFLAVIASILALTLFFHIATWLVIGVVMPPTFILLGLGTTCLVTNLWAIFAPSHFQRLFKSSWSLIRGRFSNHQVTVSNLTK